MYTITVLPIAVVRWSAFSSNNVPFAATIVADVLFASSGLLNVILFAITRPALLPSRDRRTGNGYLDTTVLSDVVTASQGFSRGHGHSMSEPREENWSDTVRRTQSFSHSDVKPVPLEDALPPMTPGTAFAV